MRQERLDSMLQYAVSFDTETHRIQPGLAAPPLVLGSMAVPNAQKIIATHGDIQVEVAPASIGKLLSKPDARTAFREMLADKRIVIVMFNAPYDMLVMTVDGATFNEDLLPQVFDAYDPQRTIVRGYCDGRVFDPQITESLHAIAQAHLGADARTGKVFINPHTGRRGRYNLENTTDQVIGRSNAKANDRFRESYYLFDNMPLEQLPFEAQTYPVDDAINTLDDALAQAGHVPSVNAHQFRAHPQNPAFGLVCTGCGCPLKDAPRDCMVKRRRRNIHDMSRQVYAHFCLSVGGVWGFYVPQTDVDVLEKKYLDMREANSAPFVAAKIVRDNGTEDEIQLKRHIAWAYGARQSCVACGGTGKVPSPKTEGRTKINCSACNGTQFDLPSTVPRSDKGNIKTDRDTLQESGDELLMSYGEQEGEKILSTYIPMLRKARACTKCGKTGAGKFGKHTCGDGPYEYRQVPLLPKTDPLKTSGRAAVEDGLHGMPRKGGVRECIQARPGYVLSSEDYTAGELVTLAQVCSELVGYSKLADALNAGLDAHLALAGTMTGRDYPTMLKLKELSDKQAANDRQAAKAANFGFPGGMAELTFVLRKRSEDGLFTPCMNGRDLDDDDVRGYKGMRPCILMGGAQACGIVKVQQYNDAECPPTCRACIENAKRLRAFWFQQWPEMNPKDGYFHIIKQLLKTIGPSGYSELTQLFTQRIRGGLNFCDGANTLFQGLLADASKDAYCAITRECLDKTCRVENSEYMTSKFAGGPSPLYGSHPLMNAHDEAIIEHPESIAPEAATRASELMVESLRFKCPKLTKACKADPTLMRRLYKGAEPRYLCRSCGDVSGKLTCKKCQVEGRLQVWEPKAKKAA